MQAPAIVRGGRTVRERIVHGAGDLSLAVSEVGAPTAPAIVIAHGVGSSTRFVLEAFAEPICAAGLRLVTYDLRGHGDSAPARSVDAQRLELHAADLGAVATEVSARFVGGVSLGAHAAARWLVDGGDADALLACLPGWIDRLPRGHGPHGQIAAEVRSVGAAGVLARVRDDPAVPSWLRDLLTRDWTRADEESLEAALLALDGGVAPSANDLRGLDPPLAVVGWHDDPGHPLETAAIWASASRAGALVTTSIEEVGGDVTALGRAAVRALRRISAI